MSAQPQATVLPLLTALEEKQQLLAHLVRMVARKQSNGLFVYGPGGLGKSLVISRTLAEEGREPVLLNSHVTPLGLYKTLLENASADAVIWLDDCEAVYANKQCLGLLRSALWGQGQRMVTYTSSALRDIPMAFPFEGRIIFCANEIPLKNEMFKAVLTRVDCFELTAGNDEILALMRKLAAKGFERMAEKSCHVVLDFIEKANGSRPLSMRLYEPAMRKVQYAALNKIDWRQLLLCQLNQFTT